MSKTDFIKEGEGFADITFAKPATINGEEVTGIRMREPTVADLKAAHVVKDDAAREVTIFANLCDCTPADIDSLTLRNYGRMQKAFELFTA